MRRERREAEGQRGRAAGAEVAHGLVEAGGGGLPAELGCRADGGVGGEDGGAKKRGADAVLFNEIEDVGADVRGGEARGQVRGAARGDLGGEVDGVGAREHAEGDGATGPDEFAIGAEDGHTDDGVAREAVFRTKRAGGAGRKHTTDRRRRCEGGIERKELPGWAEQGVDLAERHARGRDEREVVRLVFEFTAQRLAEVEERERPSGRIPKVESGAATGGHEGEAVIAEDGGAELVQGAWREDRLGRVTGDENVRCGMFRHRHRARRHGVPAPGAPFPRSPSPRGGACRG